VGMRKIVHTTVPNASSVGGGYAAIVVLITRLTFMCRRVGISDRPGKTVDYARTIAWPYVAAGSSQPVDETVGGIAHISSC
jgi:archaellum component FlaD/FlaE